MWYQDWFADERYLALYKHRNDAEAAVLLDLIERTIHPRKDASILDLACGAGRHSIAFAKRGFHHITGLDLSATLIAKAKESAAHEHIAINFVEGDMRSFAGTYDLILNIFTSFGYFEHERDDEAVIERVGHSLAQDGYFVLDFFNAAAIARSLQAHTSKTLPGGEQADEYREIAGKRVNKKIVIKFADHINEYRESVRLYSFAELSDMIARSGMRIGQVFGSYSGDGYDEERSARCIIFAKKN